MLHPFKLDLLTLSLQVCWTNPSGLVTFVGMRFTDGLLKPGTFVDDRMKASWVDRMQIHRKGGLF